MAQPGSQSLPDRVQTGGTELNRPTKLLIKIALASAALVAVLAVTAVLIAQTEWFRQYVKNKIITATESGTGGRVEIGSFAFDWKHLRSTFTHFVVHGKEPAGAPPYLEAAERTHRWTSVYSPALITCST